MITKYKINKDELVINIDFLYEVEENPKSLKNIYKYVNLIIQKENIKFLGKKIIIYIDCIYVGELYLSNFYLDKKLNYLKNEINETNSYFNYAMVLEINPKKKIIKTKKVLTY